MVVARIKDDNLLTVKEFIEYPEELYGGRNLFQKLPDMDLRNFRPGHNRITELSPTLDMVGYGDSTLASFEVVDGDIYYTPTDGWYTSGVLKGLEPNEVYLMSFTPSHEGDLGTTRLHQIFGKVWYAESDSGIRHTEEVMTDLDGRFLFQIWYDNTNGDDVDIIKRVTFRIGDIKVEKSNVATPFTPTPEDLGFSYPSWVQSFRPSVSENGIVYGDFIENEHPRELNGGRNIISKEDIGQSGSTVDFSQFDNQGMMIYEGSGRTSGITIRGSLLEPNTDYRMSYKYQKIEGDLVSFGGHAAAPWDPNMTYLDGSKEGQRHSGSDSGYAGDDKEIHSVEVHFSTYDVVQNTVFYIQPNRMQEVYAKMKIWGWKLEKGTKVTPWTPSPKDLGLEIPDDIQNFNGGVKLEGKYAPEYDGVILQNLIENGNFNSGFNGWEYADNGEIVEGIAKIKPIDPIPNTASIRHLGQIVSLVRGDIYYVTAVVKGSLDLTIAITTQGRESVKKANTWERISSVYVSGVDGSRGWGVYDDSLNFFECESMLGINLTQAFGRGNEPTKEKMNELISKIGWFDNEHIYNGEEIMYANEFIEGAVLQDSAENLLYNTAFTENAKYWTTGNVVHSERFGNVLSISAESGNSGTIQRTGDNDRVMNGETYTFSGWLKSSIPLEVGIAIDGSRLDNGYFFNSTTEWKFITFTRKSKGGNNQFRVYSVEANDGGSTIEIAQPKLEAGEEVTPWIPAPEDLTMNEFIQGDD